eukprot:COSAG02_NODE_6426_length_3578_cov_2.743030_2_plen_89_part_00
MILSVVYESNTATAAHKSITTRSRLVRHAAFASLQRKYDQRILIANGAIEATVRLGIRGRLPCIMLGSTRGSVGGHTRWVHVAWFYTM